jgi:hypothetical protein
MLSFQIFITFCGAAVVCMIVFLFAIEREIHFQQNRHSPNLASAHRVAALKVVYSNPARQTVIGRPTETDFKPNSQRSVHYKEA